MHPSRAKPISTRASLSKTDHLEPTSHETSLPNLILGRFRSGLLTIGLACLALASHATSADRIGRSFPRASNKTRADQIRTVTSGAVGPKHCATNLLVSAELNTNSPTLSITRVGTKAVISWPRAAAGFQLQFSSGLASTNTWTAVPQRPMLMKDRFQVLIPAVSGQVFYRLAKSWESALQ